jgi:hypothetical protein
VLLARALRGTPLHQQASAGTHDGSTPTSTQAGPQDTAAWLQLELTGLASVGSASDTFLIDEIRGYTPSEANSQKLFKGP